MIYLSKNRRRFYDRTFERFIQKEIFGPLGVTRPCTGVCYPNTRKYEYLPDYEPWEEARREMAYPTHAWDPNLPLPDDKRKFYAGRQLACVWDVILGGGRLAHRQHGGANYRLHESHGSWVFAAADYAKLLASFDIRNPIFSQAAVDVLFSPTPGGNHAFAVADPPFPGFAHSESTMTFGGGVAGGGGSFIFHRADGVSVVYMVNGEVQLDYETYFDPLDINSVLNHIPLDLWPEWDLFPLVGIPSFYGLSAPESAYSDMINDLSSLL